MFGLCSGRFVPRFPGRSGHRSAHSKPQHHRAFAQTTL